MIGSGVVFARHDNGHVRHVLGLDVLRHDPNALNPQDIVAAVDDEVGALDLVKYAFKREGFGLLLDFLDGLASKDPLAVPRQLMIFRHARVVQAARKSTCLNSST